MKTIQPMVRAKPDSIPNLMAKTHIAQQSRQGDQNRQARLLSIDWPERSVGDAKAQVPTPTSAEPVPDMKIHEAIDAVSAVILHAQAGLNWLGAEKPNLERALKALNSIAGDAMRVAEMVQRLRTS
jgi:hypothetical protein